MTSGALRCNVTGMTDATKVIRAALTDAQERQARARAASKGVPFPQFVGDAIRAALKPQRGQG